MKKDPPFLAQPVLAGDLLGRPARTLRAALAHARRIARRHRVTVAIWREVTDGAGQRVELVRAIEPRPVSRRR
jgi:hypothetical protein